MTEATHNFDKPFERQIVGFHKPVDNRSYLACQFLSLNCCRVSPNSTKPFASFGPGARSRHLTDLYPDLIEKLGKRPRGSPGVHPGFIKAAYDSREETCFWLLEANQL
jgi:hypothetical protein